jgi:6-phosphogluconolactonase (cycloisomerase 2 family)
MPRQSVSLATFNRGRVSALALGRNDIDRVAMSAEVQTNYVPRVLGSMMLRPGLEHIDSTLSDNPAHHVPFVFSTDDQALIELTNESMRVRVDEEVIARTAVSTVTRGGDFSADITNFLKVDDPATLPSQNANDVAFSADGRLMAVAIDADAGGTIKIYSISGTTPTFLVTPGSGTSSQASGVAFSDDGQFLAAAQSNSADFLDVWSITGTGSSASFSNITANVGTKPAAATTGVAFSPDGNFLAFSHGTTPFVTIYQISGSGGSATFTKLSDPSSLPASTGNGVSFSNDSRFMAVAHTTTPFVTIYEINGTTFTKLDNPANLPAGNGQDVKFSRDGNWMAVAHTTTPFVTIYSIDGTTFTKAANPATLPDADSRGCAFSSDNQFLAVVHGTSPFLSHYRNVSGTWTKQTDPATAPDGTGNRVAFSPNNHLMVVAHDTTAFLTLYQAYQWLDLDGSGATSTYGGGTPATSETAASITVSGSNAGFAVTIRQRITAAGITRSGSKVIVRFQGPSSGNMVVSACYIGEQAAAGDAYDFASAPTQVTFNGGSSGFTVGNTTQDSDQITFTLDETKNYVVSFHVSSGNVAAASAGSSTWVPYSKAGNDASTVNATGYTLQSGSFSSISVSRITVLNEEEGAGTGLHFVGTLYNEAKRVQAVSILNADVDVEHALRITVDQGKLMLRVGSVYGDEDLIGETTLGVGTHSLAFTPTTNLFFVQFASNTEYSSILSSCQIEGAGDMTLPTVWSTADLDFINYAQSGDIVYVACKDNRRQKIERRATHSWSVVEYQPEDGPFRPLNTSLITMTPSALSGDITLEASRDFFRETHVGALIKIRSAGQQTSDSFTAQNQFSANNIRVTGVEGARAISITRSGTWSATITLQRSLSEPGNWTDAVEFTNNGTSTYTDDLDNQIVFYRIGIKTGDYTSGTAVVSMEYASGGIVGVARVTAFTDRQNVDAIALTRFGSTDASENWAEETWSDFRGHPSAVAIYEGRLGWAGKDRLTLSVSDAYESFDEETEGDSGPINRTIGQGPVDTINWLVYSKTLIMGGEGAEHSVGTTAFDEVLTPSNYHSDPVTNIGSAPVAAIKIDKDVIFAARTRTDVYQLSYQSDVYDYTAAKLTRLIPEMCDAGIVRIESQRYPDTRLHCVLEDGTVALLVFEREEDVVCWIDITTDGLIEDVVVLPADDGVAEDKVYYVVNRTINGETKRYLEKWALESECIGGTLNEQADSFITFTNGPASATVTGLDHLEGEEVIVWADGKCLDDTDGEIETFTVSSGSISLTNDGTAYTATTGIVGLAYTAQFKSTKLAYAAAGGSAFNAKKKLVQLGLIMANTHARGIKYGDSFDSDKLRSMPSVENGQAVDEDYIWSHYDEPISPVVGGWDTDSRLCLQSQAPRPATVLAATVVMETNG